MPVLLRPPNMNPAICTPSGLSQSSSMAGFWNAGAVNRELGCAAGLPLLGSHGLPCQSVKPSGAFSVNPSHQTSLSFVIATLVKIVLELIVSIALGFV